MSSASQVFSDIPVDAQPVSNFTRMIFGPGNTGGTAVGDILLKNKAKPLKPFLNELRVMKSKAEISNMRKAGQASGRAFTEAMRRQWKTERELDTFLEYQFRTNGCEEPAYVPVVAGGLVSGIIPAELCKPEHCRLTKSECNSNTLCAQ